MADTYLGADYAAGSYFLDNEGRTFAATANGGILPDKSSWQRFDLMLVLEADDPEFPSKLRVDMAVKSDTIALELEAPQDPALTLRSFAGTVVANTAARVSSLTLTTDNLPPAGYFISAQTKHTQHLSLIHI